MDSIKENLDNWLTHRLDAQWSSEKISPLLTSEILISSVDYFFNLESNVKVNYLISFLALRKQLVKQLSNEISKVLEVAKDDTDSWVKITAKVVELLLYSNSPSPISSFDDPSFIKIINLLKSKERECEESSLRYYPMENIFLDKIIASVPEQVKHFTVKSEALTETFSWDEFDSGVSSSESEKLENKRSIHKLNVSNSKVGLNSSRIFQHSPAPSRPSMITQPISVPPPATGSNSAAEKQKMRVIDFTEVMELNKMNQNNKKRKRSATQNDDEEEKKRVKREQQDEAKRKRTEERQRKQEEAAQRKFLVEKEREQKRQIKLQEREAKQHAKIQQTSLVRIHTPPTLGHQSKLPTTSIPSFTTPILGPGVMGQESAALSQALGINYIQLQIPSSPSPLSYHPPQTVFSNFTLHKPQINSNPQLKPLQFHTTQPPAAPSTQQILESLFEDGQMLTTSQKDQISDFMTGRCRKPPDPNQPIVEMLLREKQTLTDDGKIWFEQILFEINYTRCTWRKLRRRKPLEQ